MLNTAPAVVLAHLGDAPPAAMIGVPVLVLVVFGLLERKARIRERAASQDATTVADPLDPDRKTP